MSVEVEILPTFLTLTVEWLTKLNDRCGGPDSVCESSPIIAAPQLIQEVLADSATSSSDLANVLSPGRKGNLAANSYIICWVLVDSLEQIREDLVLLPNGRQDCVH